VGRVGAGGGARTANDGRGAGGKDKRGDERFNLQAAPGTLMHKGVNIPCAMMDVSLSGCRVRTLTPFAAGALESVKVTLAIHGMVLSIWGITQWTTWRRLIGVRFLHPTGRTRNQLAGLLTCLLDESAAEVVKKAVAASALEVGSPIIVLERLLEAEAEGEADAAIEEEEFQASQPLPAMPRRPELKSEFKVLSLADGESPAVLHLVAEGSTLRGSLLDVSQDGCLARLAGSATVRVNAQAEVDFHLRGLPFRLQGTVREMREQRIVEIKFAEMSRRKREDLALVILEMIGASEAKRAT
jgi:hypothetical protein